MKYCDNCHSTYPTEFTVCPKDKTPLRETSELPDGSILRGKYQVISKIGAGGMATVYKAKHLTFNEVRALKIVSSKLLDDKDFMARFKNEAVITRKLQHPNAVRVDDFDVTDDGRPFIVMEYVEGESLRDVLHKGGPMPPQRAIAITKQVVLALSAAHKLSIVHRDIKPENILVLPKSDGSETVKVLDFGIAKLREAADASTHGPGYTPTQTGMVMGTPQYISPEQAMGQRGDQIDGRADLYSVGIVLYEMLTGDIPFKADTPMGLLIHHIHTAPTPPHTLRPELKIPAGLSQLLMKVLDKDREKRFQSADEMLAALNKPMSAAAPAATAAMGSASMTQSMPKPMKRSEMPTGPHEHHDDYADPESSQALRAFREGNDPAPTEEKGGLFDEDRARASSYYEDWMAETEEDTKVEPKRVEPVAMPSGPPKPAAPPATAVAAPGKPAAAAPAPAPQPAKIPQVFGKVQPTVIKTPPPTQSVPVASQTQRRMAASPPPKTDYRNYIIAGAAGVIITLLAVGYFALRSKPQPTPVAVSTPAPATPGIPAAPAPGTEDARIYDDVKKMLSEATSDTLRANPPLVGVDKGVVTLSGRVTSREDSMLAFQLAGTVDGVAQVVNQMKVGGVAAPRGTTNDLNMTQGTLTPRRNTGSQTTSNVLLPPEEASSVSLGEAARQRTQTQNTGGGNNTQQQIDQQLRQGYAAMQSQNYDAAIQHFQGVLQLDPQNPAALLGLRRAHRLKNGGR